MHANDAEHNLRGLRVNLTILVLLWLFSAPAMAATLDDIRQANTANESAIRTARVVCVLQADDWWDRPPIPGSSPYSATVREINRHRLERREIWCDIPGQSWRLELTDLRDVDQLMEDAELPPEQLINVSRTASWLSGRGYYATLYAPYQFMTLTRRPERTETSPQLPFGMETGVISDFLIADASAVTLADAERDGLSLVELRVTKESITWSVLLDPALNYRFRWWTRQTAEGQVQQEQVAGDYRKVNGIDYPFSYAERKWDAAGTLTEEKSINVEDAEFNMPLAREDLELLIPAGTSIQDMVSRARVKTPAEVRVDIDSARELAPNIKAQQKEESPPPPSQPEEAPETQPAPDTQPSSETDDADTESSPETQPAESTAPASSRRLPILGVGIVVLAIVAAVILRMRRSKARYGAE